MLVSYPPFYYATTNVCISLHVWFSIMFPSTELCFIWSIFKWYLDKIVTFPNLTISLLMIATSEATKSLVTSNLTIACTLVSKYFCIFTSRRPSKPSSYDTRTTREWARSRHLVWVDKCIMLYYICTMLNRLAKAKDWKSMHLRKLLDCMLGWCLHLPFM